MPVEVTALATGAHISCPHPLTLEMSISRGGDVARGEAAAEGGMEGEEEWHTVFFEANSTALPQVRESESGGVCIIVKVCVRVCA